VASYLSIKIIFQNAKREIMLNQMFKLGSLVAICVTLLFTGCEQMDADIAMSEDFNPTEKLAFGVAGHEGAGPKGGPKGFGKCFDIVFPVTVIYPDKTTKEVASKEAYMTLIKSWKEANPASKERPTLAFPFEVTLEDGSMATIENEDGLKTLAMSCRPEGGKKGGICGGCFTPVFPVTISFPDGTSKVAASATDFKAQLDAWRAANTSSTGHPQITFPYSVKLKLDSSIVVLKNADDLKALMAACKEERPHRPSCFSVVFPVTIFYPGGKEESATDQKDFVTKVRAWRTANPTATGRPEMKFPLTVKFTDGTTKVVNSKEDLKTTASACKG
jgi:hypothetical protein